MTNFKRVGIVYHGLLDTAIEFSSELERFVQQQCGASTWRAAAAEDAEIRRRAGDSDLLLGVGGDGTLLRTARGAADAGTPIVGINLGKLGFMTEFGAAEAFEKLPRLFKGEGWIDTRTMISAQLAHRSQVFHALNDFVVARGGSSRVVRVSTSVDGQALTTYRADGVVVATATGSTGYALAAGGAILHPRSQDIVLQPICPHLSFSRCLILPSGSTIELEVSADKQALFSVDGQSELPMKSGDRIIIRRSNNVTKFLRLHPPEHFYGSLTQRLIGDIVC